MADFPASTVVSPKAVVASHGATSVFGVACLLMAQNASSTAVWPSINLAIFIPVTVEAPVLAQNMAVGVGAQSGNVDVGVYDEKGNKIVTAGTTAVGAVGLQVFNIADTVLNPGTYFLAMSCDNTTAAFNRSAMGVTNSQTFGMQQMASAFVLPATVTFANPANAYQPVISLLCAATV